MRLGLPLFLALPEDSHFDRECVWGEVGGVLQHHIQLLSLSGCPRCPLACLRHPLPPSVGPFYHNMPPDLISPKLSLCFPTCTLKEEYSL